METSPNPSARFESMFDLHHDAVQFYCLRRLPRDEVNDAVAEIFLTAWRRIDSRPAGKELPWLYAIAKNIVRNKHRSRQRYSRLRDRVAAYAVESAPTPEAQVVQRFEDQALLEALATLRDTDQEILRLKAWEEMNNDDIATTLGIKVRAVEMRVNRSRKRLAAAYKRLGQAAPQPISPRTVEEGGER